MNRPTYDVPAVPRSLQRLALTGLDWHLLRTKCFPKQPDDEIIQRLEHELVKVLKKLERERSVYLNELAAKRQEKRYGKRKKKGVETCWCGKPAAPGPQTPRCLEHALGAQYENFLAGDLVAVLFGETFQDGKIVYTPAKRRTLFKLSESCFRRKS